MNLQKHIAAGAAKLSGAFPVTKSYNLDGDLILTVKIASHTGPRHYDLDGRIENAVSAMIFRRTQAAGMTC